MNVKNKTNETSPNRFKITYISEAIEMSANKNNLFNCLREFHFNSRRVTDKPVHDGRHHSSLNIEDHAVPETYAIAK